jgi:hypothetical protein
MDHVEGCPSGDFGPCDCPKAMTFEQYVAEIQKLAEACGATDPGKAYCDAESWRDGFNDGLTPAEQWSEEVSAAASMLG